MTSHTMSAVVHITICLSVFCNINALTSETPPTHLSMSKKNSEQTTLSTALDVSKSSSNTNTASLNTTELPLSSTSTLPPSSTSAATTQGTINVSEPSTMSVAATSALQSPSTIPLTGSSGSAENRTDLKTTTQTTAITSILSTQKEPASQTNATDPTSNFTVATTPLSDADQQSLKYSEIILTSIFSTILVIVVLVILAYGFKKCLGPRSQYSHHPLRETPFDSETGAAEEHRSATHADQYSPPDDTLVISGGLYDAPRIYNPNMTVLEEDETQNDFVSFNSRLGQFRLEFLPGDKDLDPSFNRSHRKHV